MKRLQLLIILFMVCFLNIAWMWHSNPKADDSMQKGYDAWQSGNLTEALSFYEDALKYEPKRADALNFLGVIYEELGLSDKAEEKYLSAIKMDNALLSAYFNLGVLYWNRGEVQKSIYYFQKRVEMGMPNDQWTIKAQKALNNIKAKENLTRHSKIDENMDVVNAPVSQGIKNADQYDINRDLEKLEKSVVAQQNMNVDFKEMGQPEKYQMKLDKKQKSGEVLVKSYEETSNKPAITKTPEIVPVKVVKENVSTHSSSDLHQSKVKTSSEDANEPQGYQQGLIPWMSKGIKSLF